MKRRKLKTVYGIPVLMLVMAVLASMMVFSGTAAAARAVLTEGSSQYDADVSLGSGVAVSLKENGKEVEGDDALMNSLIPEGEKLLPGKEYAEKLTVSNTGSEPAFVRVTITRYWEKNGEKDPTLNPSLILLTTAEGWTEDEDARTSERIVLYRNEALKAGEDSAFASGITIDGKTASYVIQTENAGTVTNKYLYDEATFKVEVKADAVQTHSGEKAVKSAWGRDVSVSGDSLSLN